MNWEKWNTSQTYFIGYQRKVYCNNKWEVPIFSPAICLHFITTGTRSKDRRQCAPQGETDLITLRSSNLLHWPWQVDSSEICSQLFLPTWCGTMSVISPHHVEVGLLSLRKPVFPIVQILLQCGLRAYLTPPHTHFAELLRIILYLFA